MADSGSKGKSLLGIIISIIVLLIISTMIVAAIVIINPEIGNISGRQHLSREAITMEEALLGELSSRDIDFRWMSSPGDNNNNNNGESSDLLLWEEFKNIQLATLPSSEHRNSLLANTSTQQANQIPTGAQPQQQQQSFKPTITTLVSNASLLSSIEYQGYKLSPSRRYLLIWTARRKQFRHSSTAKYFLYDIKSDLISLLSTRNSNQKSLRSNQSSNGDMYGDEESHRPVHNHYEQLDSASIYLSDQLGSTEDESARFQVVSWFSAPDKSDKPGRTKDIVDSLLLIQNNDIYVLGNVADLSSSTSLQNNNQATSPSRITWSGKQHEIFNGIPDWLYEEEILGDTPAFQVSPGGSRLAYMSFNDSRVSTMPFSYYGEQVIPRIQRIRYPKTGTPNPTVAVHIVENLGVSGGHMNDIELRLPDELAQQQHYINRINWLTDQRLALIWSNRNQNESFVLLCSKMSQWRCEKNLHLAASGGWLDMSDDLYPLDDDYYIALLPKFEGPEVGSFKHLARVSLNKPNTYNFITSGRKDVTSINGVDSKRLLVYYTSTVVDEPGQRQMFVAELESTSTRVADMPQASPKRARQQSHQATNNEDQEPPGASVCVTCDHYPSECLYNVVKLSSSTNYYVFYCEGPGVPRIELRATRRRRHRLSHLRTSKTDYAASQRTKKLVGELASETGHSLDNKLNGPLAALGNKSTVVDEANQSMADKNAAPNGADLEQADEGYASPGDDVEGNPNGGQENLLWTIEDNKDLRDKLERVKAMPLTMRLKVPIGGTNYSANVVLLLPPQLSPTATFKSSSLSSQSASPLSAAAPSMSNVPQRPRRGALAAGILSGRHLNEDRPLHSYYTPETVGEYSNQLNNGQKFPMVVDVYAGPGSQRVDFRFSVYFGHYLASSRRTIYATIDGRGSGYQGTKRLYELYHKFGTVEIQDQIDVAAYLAKNLTFIDASKVAIWGWSYGGYAAAMALAQSNAQARQHFQAQLKSLKPNQLVQNITAATTTKAPPPPPSPSPSTTTPGHLTAPGNSLSQTTISANGLAKSMGGPAATNNPPELIDSIGALRPLMRLTTGAPFPSPPSLRGVFECAVSVAPVTNWIYYDTAYTEKYMSSPWANEHYDQSMVADHLGPSPNKPAVSNATSDYEPKLGWSLPPRPITNSWSPVNQTILPGSQTDPSSGPLRWNKKPTTSNQLDLNERYKQASLLEHIANIDRKRFLLIHGTADDNVHFQQSVMLMKRLIQGNILFETRLYPDQDHSINNRADKLHLGSTLTNFFSECFDVSS